MEDQEMKHITSATKSRPAKADSLTEVLCKISPDYCADACKGEGRIEFAGLCLPNPFAD